MAASRRLPSRGGAGVGSRVDPEAAPHDGEDPGGLAAHGRRTGARARRRPGVLPRIVGGAPDLPARRPSAGGDPRACAGSERSRSRRGAGGGAVPGRLDRPAHGCTPRRLVAVAAVVTTHDARPVTALVVGASVGSSSVAAPTAR